MQCIVGEWLRRLSAGLIRTITASDSGTKATPVEHRDIVEALNGGKLIKDVATTVLDVPNFFAIGIHAIIEFMLSPWTIAMRIVALKGLLVLENSYNRL